MSFNGSGLFQINSAGQPVVNGTTIDDTVFNALMADIAAGLSNTICKDGQTTPTANIPMGGNKLTGLAPGTARTDAASLATIQDGTGVYVGTVGGTADVITLAPSPAIASYTAGQTFRFIASGANTTNVTVNVSGLGAKAVTKNGTTALVADDILAGMLVTVVYDGTRFVVVGRIDTALYYRVSGGAIGGRAYTTTNTISYGATVTVNAALSNYFEVGTLTGNVSTLTINNPIGGQTITIRVKQDGTGNRTVAAPSGAKISGAVSPTANVVSHLTLTYSTADSRWEGYWSSVPA